MGPPGEAERAAPYRFFRAVGTGCEGGGRTSLGRWDDQVAGILALELPGEYLSWPGRAEGSSPWLSTAIRRENENELSTLVVARMLKEGALAPQGQGRARQSRDLNLDRGGFTLPIFQAQSRAS